MTTIAPYRPFTAFSATPTFLQNRARALLHRVLTKLRHGQVTLIDEAGRHSFGSDPALHCTITIKDPRAYISILSGGSVGAGESYIDGFWETDRLTDLVRIIARNQAVLQDMEEQSSTLVRLLRRIGHFWHRNNRSGSKNNIIAHYDLGNELYAAFLDKTMMYSSAIYPASDSSLEEAARYKLDHICRRLQLGPQDHVLEIGSGWGGFAIHAATHYGCRVTTTTISEAQYEEAQRRINAAGLAGQITLLRQDYRDLQGAYDKLVSIEMIEAVGDRYLPEFFEKCMSLLQPGGVMLLQAITIRDQKYEEYLGDVDFIQKHIFPGGCLTANSRMLDVLSRSTDLVVRGIDDFGFDYARTLRDWRDRFHAAFTGLKEYGYDERFRRLWEFYLCYCEGGFLERTISVVQLVADRPGNRLSARRTP
jgi:cyclopropane-fatty-acyl-phospholipid synthase